MRRDSRVDFRQARRYSRYHCFTCCQVFEPMAHMTQYISRNQEIPFRNPPNTRFYVPRPPVSRLTKSCCFSITDKITDPKQRALQLP
jgi:hypothetical protein